ncbi:TonB-dependent receptor plug domain-containing protein [Pseudoalteromonas denitrificans]|uniref:Outer membrane receptor proteins, mostly Fe transport n=1 Tax=Pseudoalteromonas denitrificans DSM 6059 TaxID=1123010 RepID=A0A1I1LIV0_9GAMM|nr:TonB-dependent receptor [Pseudoalteromonas denitrificans]SFC72961.1 Outer membrane receptor proteins, mostly Fe transport [Pseudoalteromonas denitrificans DSM 6059]
MKLSICYFSILVLTPCVFVNGAELQKDLFDLSIEDLFDVKVEGSTLTTESLKTVPSAVTVFEYKEINRLAVGTLDELMPLVPGFQSYRTASSSVHYPFSSRGRRIGSPASEILILIDGQRIEEPRVSGSAVIMPKISLNNIQKVEFIRGPGAAIYGSNAMMGIINMQTRKKENEFSFSFGSFNRKKAYALITNTMGDVTLDLFSQISDDKGDDFFVKDTFSGNRIYTDDPRKQFDINFKVYSDKTRLSVSHNQFSSKNFYELDRISNGINYRKGQLSTISFKHAFNWLSVKSHFWSSFSKSNAEIASQLTAPGQLVDFSVPSTDDVFLIKAILNDYKQNKVQWHNDWAIKENANLKFGFEFRHIKAPEGYSLGNFNLEDLSNQKYPIPYFGELSHSVVVQLASKRDILGAYVQYQQSVFESSNLTLGARYDDFSHIGSQLSPRLSLVTQLNNNQSIKFLYGQAYRAPTENELNLVNNPVIEGNLNLRSETLSNSEIIWLGQWSKTGLSIGYFENHFKDSIIQNSTGNGLIYDNAEQEDAKGLEFELSHEVNENWLIKGTYSKFNSKQDLSFREATELASLMVNYQYHNLNVNFISWYQSSREMAVESSNKKRIKLDGYWLVSSKIQYKLTTHLDVYFQAKNIFNEAYFTPPANAVLEEGVANRGREITLGIKWSF